MSIFLKSQKIIKDWIDYNGHMNVAYYVLIFDEASEGMLNKFKMGAIDAKANNRSTMVVESRITYNNEVKENEEVEVYCNFFDHDKKRPFLVMIEEITINFNFFIFFYLVIVCNSRFNDHCTSIICLCINCSHFKFIKHTL